MEYNLLSIEDMKAEIEARLKGLEAQHFSASCSEKEFEHLGKEYDEFRQREWDKQQELEKLISFLRDSLAAL